MSTRVPLGTQSAASQEKVKGDGPAEPDPRRKPLVRPARAFIGRRIMAKATVGTKSRQAAQIRSDEVLASVEGLSMDSVTKNITDTQVEVQEQLAGLSAKLTEQLRVLRTIEEAITLK